MSYGHRRGKGYHRYRRHGWGGPYRGYGYGLGFSD